MALAKRMLRLAAYYSVPAVLAEDLGRASCLSL